MSEDERGLHLARAMGEFNAYMKAVPTEGRGGDQDEADLAEQAMHAHLSAAEQARDAT